MNQTTIRNFCIISHIDHGKSTLADRLLEATSTIPPREMRDRILDNMELERERGITIKLKAVRMTYQTAGSVFTLNLIDTPGHVDFSYEVSRSIAACEGALLLVDATQGIQAQTLATFYQAQEQGLVIIPIVNKIDLPNAQVEKVTQDLLANLGFKKEHIILASAKNGTGVNEILDAIVERVPSPKGDGHAPFRALIFDSSYDIHKGVVVYIRIVDGSLNLKANPRTKIKFLATQAESDILEVGYFAPEMKSGESLSVGEVGYIATGLKDVSLCRVGDTVIVSNEGLFQPSAVPGYRQIKPMVFMGLFPVSNDQYLFLKEALEKMKLSDASLTFTPESSLALGNGFRCGFLGLLHADIIQERLEREYNLNLIASVPNVEYQVALKNGEKLLIRTPSELPDQTSIGEIAEPWIAVKIFTPAQFIGSIMQLTQEKRAVYKNMAYLGERVLMDYEMPLSELIIDFYDKLKSYSQGYASLDYEFLAFRQVEAVKLEFLVAGEAVDALSQIVVKEKMVDVGRQVTARLKEVLPRQQFVVSLQAAVGGKIVAREDLPTFRKDVLSKMSGGDYTRKMKLLEKQKKGKRRMKHIGKVDIPQEAFLAVLKK